MPEAPEVRSAGEMPAHESSGPVQVERLPEERDGSAVETLELALGEGNAAGEDYARPGVRGAKLSREIERAKVEIEKHEVDVAARELHQDRRPRIGRENVEAVARELGDELRRRALGLREDEDAVHDDDVNEQD